MWAEIESLYRGRFAAFALVARAVTGDREAALEAVQEGFVDALRSSAQYDGRGSLEAWVWRCVVNRARKGRRSQMRRPQPELVAELVSSNGSGGDGVGELRVRLAGLPERQKLVVFLRYYADLEYREIAAVLGVRVGTVSATLSSAHAVLRAHLEATGA